MRRTNRSGGFFLTLLINIVLNFEGAIPGVVLMILHYTIDISIWWSVGAFAVWILYLIFFMFIIGWASSCSNAPEIQKENKNPYSSGPYKSSK